ncbi:hypothetical protein [Paenibacillus alvei]|uniref:hypothetical protein n=1 Tax=Paenibacillus alvei TaxID=44250 RepID=UPI00227EA8B4|nr:hypothetical protein [Paenibacillus alvei]MCY7484629.1 hypothetical protein [Paenibacillus alvei]
MAVVLLVWLAIPVLLYPGGERYLLPLERLWKEHRQNTISMTIGLAHKFVADHPDTKLVHIIHGSIIGAAYEHDRTKA